MSGEHNPDELTTERHTQLPIVEIRVHGVSGTAPESLLGTPHVVQVGGDGLGRIFRPSDPYGNPINGTPLGPDGSQERVVEGYHWGRMTSGGWSKAIWALLFPFALANVAYWMLPPRKQMKQAGRICHAACRGLLRLSAFTLSAMLMAQFAVGALDLIANQCAYSSKRCLSSVPHLGWFWNHPQVRSILAVAALMLGVFIINRISTSAWTASCLQSAKATATVPAEIGGPEFYAGDPDVPTLRALHVICSLATASILALGGPHAPDRGHELVLWLVAWALWAAAAITVTLMDDPTNAGHRTTHDFARRGALHVGRPLAAIVLAAVGLFGPLTHDRPAGIGGNGEPNPLVGSNDFVGGLMVALSLLTALIAVVLIVPAVQAAHARRTDANLATPKPFRPWVGGWFSAPVSALAGLFGAGLGLGLTYTARGCLQGSCSPQVGKSSDNGLLRVPSFYASLTEMWGITAAAVAIALLLSVIVSLIRVLGAYRTPPSGVDRSPYAPGFLLQGATTGGARVKVAADWQAARMKLSAGPALTGLAVLMSAVGALALDAQWLRDRETDETLPHWIGRLIDHPPISTLAHALHLDDHTVFTDFGNIGVYAVDALALGLLYAVYNAARRPNSARQLGILWDLASYWPRAAHPYVPPCYAQKVVPELVDRIEQYTKAGHRVVLCGHSQGSLLAASAVLRLMAVSPTALDRVGLVTAGSQLQWAYPRGFPSVIDVQAYRVMLARLDGRWRSLTRGTDPLGGAVLTWDQQVNAGRPGGAALEAQALTLITAAAPGRPVSDCGDETPTHARVIGNEHWLADPFRPDGPYVADVHRPGFHPGTHAHSDFWLDPEWNRAISIAAGLERAPVTDRQPEPQADSDSTTASASASESASRSAMPAASTGLLKK